MSFKDTAMAKLQACQDWLGKELRKGDDSGWKKHLATIEEKTKVKREYVVAVLGVLYLLYLIIGDSARLACNLVAYVYPAYASVKALKSTQKEDDTYWLTYWAVFGVFSVADALADGILEYFPIYWAAKVVFLVYLYHPEMHGAQKVYTAVVLPLAKKYGKVPSEGGRAAPAASAPAPAAEAPASEPHAEEKPAEGEQQDEDDKEMVEKMGETA